MYFNRYSRCKKWSVIFFLYQRKLAFLRTKTDDDKAVVAVYLNFLPDFFIRKKHHTTHHTHTKQEQNQHPIQQATKQALSYYWNTFCYSKKDAVVERDIHSIEKQSISRAKIIDHEWN